MAFSLFPPFVEFALLRRCLQCRCRIRRDILCEDNSEIWKEKLNVRQRNFMFLVPFLRWLTANLDGFEEPNFVTAGPG
jgi:hypothetical protein